MNPADIAIAALAGFIVGGLSLLSVVFVFYEFVDKGSLGAAAAVGAIVAVIAVMLGGGSTGGLFALRPILEDPLGLRYYLLTEFATFVLGFGAYLAARWLRGRQS